MGRGSAVRMNRSDLFASSSDEEDESEQADPARVGGFGSVATVVPVADPSATVADTTARLESSTYYSKLPYSLPAAATAPSALDSADWERRSPRIPGADLPVDEVSSQPTGTNIAAADELDNFKAKQLEERNQVLADRVRELENRVAVASAGEQRQAATNASASAASAKTIQGLHAGLALAQERVASLEQRLEEVKAEVAVLLEQLDAAEAAAAAREIALTSANEWLSQELERRLAQVDELEQEVPPLILSTCVCIAPRALPCNLAWGATTAGAGGAGGERRCRSGAPPDLPCACHWGHTCAC